MPEIKYEVIKKPPLSFEHLPQIKSDLGETPLWEFSVRLGLWLTYNNWNKKPPQFLGRLEGAGLNSA